MSSRPSLLLSLDRPASDRSDSAAVKGVQTYVHRIAGVAYCHTPSQKPDFTRDAGVYLGNEKVATAKICTPWRFSPHAPSVISLIPEFKVGLCIWNKVAPLQKDITNSETFHSVQFEESQRIARHFDESS